MATTSNKREVEQLILRFISENSYYIEKVEAKAQGAYTGHPRFRYAVHLPEYQLLKLLGIDKEEGADKAKAHKSLHTLITEKGISKESLKETKPEDWASIDAIAHIIYNARDELKKHTFLNEQDSQFIFKKITQIGKKHKISSATSRGIPNPEYKLPKAIAATLNLEFKDFLDNLPNTYSSIFCHYESKCNEGEGILPKVRNFYLDLKKLRLVF